MANFFKKNQIPAPEVLTLSKRNLKYIHSGMYWFTDNTLSDKLQKGKDLRAVVLQRNRKGFVALLFDEWELIYDVNGDYRVYAPQTIIDDRQMYCEKFIPSLAVLQAAYFHVELLNKRLKEAGKPELQGIYWSWDQNNNWPGFRYTLPNGHKVLIGKGSPAKLRPVLAVHIKK